MGVDTGVEGYAALSANINKQKGEPYPESKPGVVSDKLSELTLEMTDEQIIKLTDQWEKAWKDSPTKSDWQTQIEENEKYWLGKQFDTPKLDKSRAQVDNIIFEAVETYLPQVTRRNPEPLVTLDSTVESTPVYETFKEKVKGQLADLSDKNKLRLKLKKGARHWAIYQIGVAKFGWDLDRDIPIVRIIRPKKIILDPEATIDEDGYTGDYIGEYRKLTATKILAIIGEENETTTKARKAITDLVKDELGTKVQFIEWWTSEYMCWKLDSDILLKKKNPHWNYDTTAPQQNVDEFGGVTETQQEVKGLNHLPSPEMPYKFLSVFNLGDQPMDKTSLIGQNLANQDLINKRNKQIDKNADSMNGGMVVSLGRSGLTQSQARGVTEALKKGGTVVIPDGSPREAVDRYPAPGLPPDVYNQLNDTRIRLRDIFGIRGSSAAGLESENTVRGKILNKGLDTDRIGGGISEYLEQWADDWYNWFLQLLYVYDTDFQFLAGATPPKVVISVKEGSLLPKDSTSIANQAMELAKMNRISTIDLYKRLEFPNPEELAANLWLETNAPQLLYRDNPLVQEALQMQQQASMAQVQAETGKSQQVHEQNMQTEALKVAGKSLLSEVRVK